MFRPNRRKAFTLLELIVVVVVLGILAALAIPSFSTVKQSAADKVAVQSAESVVRNAKALAAFDGAALSDAYVDQAGAEIGVKYNSSTNTVTISSGGETGAASINATTGAVTVSAATNGGNTPPAPFEPTMSFDRNSFGMGSCNLFGPGGFNANNPANTWLAYCVQTPFVNAITGLSSGDRIRITVSGTPYIYTIASVSNSGTLTIVIQEPAFDFGATYEPSQIEL
jgi:type IV pilus assembly protein PilA